jgi:integrase
MNLVKPIWDKEAIQSIKKWLKAKNERNYILFLFGINTGMRVSDILKLRVKGVEGWSVFIHEGKKKTKEVRMPSELKKAVREYCKGKTKNEYLFKSMIGKNKPITRGMAYVILQEIADKIRVRKDWHSFFP